MSRTPAKTNRNVVALWWRCFSALTLVSALALAAVGQTTTKEVTVAAAADLGPVLQELQKMLDRRGVKMKLVLGSSGNLSVQIQNGAPFDVFLSADPGYVQRLVAQGVADGNTSCSYARGRLVLWVPKSSQLNLSDGLNALSSDRVQKLAIANPDHAPYGRAAVTALRRAGVYDQVSRKLVIGENVAQAAQFALSGNAQAGVIALSLALSPAMQREGRFVEVPQTSYDEIRQVLVVLKRGQGNPVVRAFLETLTSKDANALFQQYGFMNVKEGVPPACNGR